MEKITGAVLNKIKLRHQDGDHDEEAPKDGERPAGESRAQQQGGLRAHHETLRDAPEHSCVRFRSGHPCVRRLPTAWCSSAPTGG